MTPERQKELEEWVRKKNENDKVEEAASCSASIAVVGAMIYVIIISQIAEDNYDFAAKIVIGTLVMTVCVGRIISFLISKKILLKKDNYRKKLTQYYLLGFFNMLGIGSFLCIFYGLIIYAIELFSK